MSVKCSYCGLYNSFSFSTSQENCIKCNGDLYLQDVEEAKHYSTTLHQRDFKTLNSWNNTDDTFTIGTKKHV